MWLSAFLQCLRTIFNIKSQLATEQSGLACDAAIKNMHIHKELSEFHPNTEQRSLVTEEQEVNTASLLNL